MNSGHVLSSYLKRFVIFSKLGEKFYFVNIFFLKIEIEVDLYTTLAFDEIK